MARYIDADALRLDVDLSKGATVLDMALSVIKAVQEAPTADVLEVVRCKDCTHLTDEGLCFKGINGVVGYKKPNAADFCSYGERKIEE